MMYQSPPLGSTGIVPDLGTNHPLPLGAWEDVKNLRFNDSHIRRIKDPVEALPTVADDATWLQLYTDDIGPRIAYGTPTKLYRLNIAGDTWEDVTRLSGDYTSGDWHSFSWGESVIFNNGVDVPQILTAGSSAFVDLPNWGLLTSGQKAVTAKSLRPFNNVLVACNVTIDGVEFPNMDWWSAPAVIDNNDANFNQPSWDYEDPSTLSGFNYVGVNSGPIVDSLSLDTVHIIYTKFATFAMRPIGGRLIYAFTRILDYGLARLGAVVDYNNFHFVAGPTSIFRHDGSVITHLADGRIEDSFFNSLASTETLRCTQDIGNKEIHTLYQNRNGDWEYGIYNYDEDTWSRGDASKDGKDVVCMAYGQEQDLDAETYDTVTTTYATETRTYAEVFPKAEGRRMYWLLTDKLMLAEESTVKDPNKDYYVSSGFLSFSELGPEFTTNVAKSFQRIYPHIEGTADTQFTISRAKLLGQPLTAGQRVRTFVPGVSDKVAFRATARFFIMRIDLVSDGDWEMPTMNYDLGIKHGR